VALWCLFFETLLSTKGVCSETAGAKCATGSSARHSHRIFACTCRNRTSARTPRPESTASRAEHIVGEGKVRFFLFWNTCRGVHTRVQPQRGAGAERAGACYEFNGQARGRGGVRVGVDRKGFGAGPRNPKRPDLDVLPDHRLQGKRAHRGQKNMWRVAQVLRCPPSRSAQSARRIARFA
jgi:hypothetical protein